MLRLQEGNRFLIKVRSTVQVSDGPTWTVRAVGIGKWPETVSQTKAEGRDKLFIWVVGEQLFETVRVDGGYNFE